jgi:hypothetical protein
MESASVAVAKVRRATAGATRYLGRFATDIEGAVGVAKSVKAASTKGAQAVEESASTNGAQAVPELERERDQLLVQLNRQ